jgi:putative drug exporter of the RND superfamily
VVVAFVVGLSFLLLVVVFRSVVVAGQGRGREPAEDRRGVRRRGRVFSWGWGSGLLGVDHDVPVSSWVPILMFAVAFGLSMDDEVFLLSRVREEWLRSGDARGSVVTGLAATGLLGSWNWWLPGWLDRLLPHLDLEADDRDDTATDVPALPAPAAAGRVPVGGDPSPGGEVVVAVDDDCPQPAATGLRRGRRTPRRPWRPRGCGRPAPA